MHQQSSNFAERTARPQGWRTIRHFAYVDRPFRDVRRALAGAPQRIIADSSGSTGCESEAKAELRLHRAGVDLTRDVRMILGDVEIGVHSACLPIRWEDATRPELFPILDATLEAAPVRAGRHAMTQLGLFGRYRPPFSRLGQLGDNVAGHQIVVESVARFLDDLAERFGATLPAPEPDPEAEDDGACAAPEASPGRRRIVLPADKLDHAPGGAAGLALRLLGEPGVLDASVNPRNGLAVIDYDGAACSLARLLHVLEV